MIFISPGTASNGSQDNPTHILPTTTPSLTYNTGDEFNVNSSNVMPYSMWSSFPTTMPNDTMYPSACMQRSAANAYGQHHSSPTYSSQYAAGYYGNMGVEYFQGMSAAAQSVGSGFSQMGMYPGSYQSAYARGMSYPQTGANCNAVDYSDKFQLLS